MQMETILLLRIFLWIPLCLILWIAAIIAAAVWGHNKTMARAKKNDLPFDLPGCSR